MEHYQAALESGRLCTTLEEVHELQDLWNQTTWRCGLCDKAMCTTTNRVWTGNKCILAYHSNEFFGLSQSDRAQLEGKDVRSWTPPSNIVVSKKHGR
ncbi:hypothetical protein ACHAXH_000332 [Discostella pseudostelligera]